MIAASDLKGVMAMMPAFATDDAADIRSTSTVDLNRLRHGLDKMIGDGADVIATTGSFGEFHTLLPREYETLVNEAVAINRKRVPIFVGATSTNPRQTIEMIRTAEQAGADGVLVGIPFYFPSTVDNALKFYSEIASMFPKLGIMIYHNPLLHNVMLPPEAIAELVKLPSVVAMKDSHRTPEAMDQLAAITRNKLSMFVFHTQYADYARRGAAGFWSIDAWMGPEPHLALRNAVAKGDWEAAKAITADLAPPAGTPPPDMSWRETGSKLAVRAAGYVDPGPLRPPFLIVPDEVRERVEKRAQRWKLLRAKYRNELSKVAS